MITQSIKLNLIPGDVPKHIEVSQYDTDSRTLSFTLYNGAVAFTTAGVTAQIRGTKPDKKGFEYTATYNAGVVTADVTEQMTACAGEVICELQLSKDGQILGTANFILDVERAALGEDTDISETELPDIIDGARTQAANAAESAEDAAESAAIAEQAASGVYLGINMGKVVTVTSGVADTDIDLERMPKPGERILLVFEYERTGVTTIKTYIDGAGITIPIGTGEPSQKYLGQYVFECASGTQPESRLWNMVAKDYGVLPTPFAISVGGTGNTSGYIRTGREGSSTVGTAATIEGTHNQAGYANQTVMGTYNNNKADTLLEVGNGTSSARSNALEVYSNGHVVDGLGNDMESLSALEATASGNPIVVNAVDVACKELVVTIEPIQEGSGDPSPENIRPISGRTGTSVSTRNEDNTETASATISFGTTVYGGQVDFKTGRVRVTHEIYDMGDILWNYYPAKQYFYSAFAGYGALKPASGVLPNLISSCYKTVNTSNDTNIMDGKDSAISYYVPSNAFQVVVKDTRYTDASALATALSGQTVCFDLATPTELTLTPAELQLLKGYNYITGDGDMEIIYIPESVLPPAPTTDGTYTLTCTVADGVPVFSWVAG